MNMLDISIDIRLNNKSDLVKVVDVLKHQYIDKPIYIVELSNSFQIIFDSEYEHFEIETEVANIYPGYEFVSDLDKGRREIKITIHRSKSPFSSDDWGRRFNSDSIETTTYLVRKSRIGNEKKEEPNQTFRVLFGEIEKEYTVNIVPGINKSTEEKGFIIVKDSNDEKEKVKLLINQLFYDKSEAFWRGFNLLTEQVERDFDEYSKSLKRKRKRK